MVLLATTAGCEAAKPSKAIMSRHLSLTALRRLGFARLRPAPLFRSRYLPLRLCAWLCRGFAVPLPHPRIFLGPRGPRGPYRPLPSSPLLHIMRSSSGRCRVTRCVALQSVSESLCPVFTHPPASTPSTRHGTTRCRADGQLVCSPSVCLRPCAGRAAPRVGVAHDQRLAE